MGTIRVIRIKHTATPEPTAVSATETFRIESRWPSWARWRIVTPKPHGERCPFDSKGLVFASRADANIAANSLSCANSGKYRVTRER